jgi:hypothetical protein
VSVAPKDDDEWEPDEPTVFEVDENDWRNSRESLKENLKFEKDELISKGRESTMMYSKNS